MRLREVKELAQVYMRIKNVKINLGTTVVLLTYSKAYIFHHQSPSLLHGSSLGGKAVRVWNG